MNDVVKDVAQDALSTGVEKSADVNFSWGKVAEKKNELSDEENRKLAGKLILLYLAGTIIGIILLSTNLIRAEMKAFSVSVFLPIGLYSLITGKALLKPSHTKHSLLLGWKGRVVGVIFIIIGIAVWF